MIHLRTFLNTCAAFLIVLGVNAQEGMWIPNLLEGKVEAEMKKLGMEIDAGDIFQTDGPSLKDAVVHFGGFCTGEVISSKGLVLTNHHCGYSSIQEHSSLENNYLEDGFWAQSMEEEMPNPGLFVRFVREIKDVTDTILEGVSAEMSEEDRKSKIRRNIDAYKEGIDLGEFEELEVHDYYDGNQYYAIRSVRYEDVRLVAAPPSSIGKFGADTDNWIWPRHTGDFSVFRIYAGPDNQPAEYSEENVPYQAETFFKIDMGGVNEGDFTFVFGFPGTTNEYLPAIAVDQMVEEINPEKIEIRNRSLGIMDEAMRNDEEVKIQYASKFASLANSWKRWQGENLGLKESRAIEAIQAEEENFVNKAKMKDEWTDQYEGVLDGLYAHYEEIAGLRVQNAVYREIITRNIEAMRVAGLLHRLAQAYEQAGQSAYENFGSQLKPYLRDLLKNYRPEIDEAIAIELLQYYNEIMYEELQPEFLRAKEKEVESKLKSIYENSKIAKGEGLEYIVENGGEFRDAILQDPYYQLYVSFSDIFEEKVQVPLSQSRDHRDSLQRIYMRGIVEMFEDQRRVYPNANGTLRVSFGQVRPYYPKDAVKYLTSTYLEGVMDKYVPGDYEFDVPEKLRNLYYDKDYSDYGEGRFMPVCFIATNHTTGGNSGSPAINSEGHLVGINFDRAWEGTMSDYYYDIGRCRNIMVDIRYVLFILDQFGDCGHLVEEMELVNQE